MKYDVLIVGAGVTADVTARAPGAAHPDATGAAFPTRAPSG